MSVCLPVNADVIPNAPHLESFFLAANSDDPTFQYDVTRVNIRSDVKGVILVITHS